MKDLIKAGKELNDLLFDDDEINVKGTKEEIETQIKEAAELIDPTKDAVSDETQAVLEELGVWPDEKGDKEDPGDNLVDQINDAATMKELKIIAKDLDEFKSLRGILTKYKTKDDLREVMLETLEEGEPEKKEEKKPAAEKAPPAKKEPVKTTEKKKEVTKKPGVIISIVSLIEKSGKKGVTKDEIHEKLVELFPDRDEKSMRSTINVQVPNRITKEKFEVEKTKDGSYRKA